MIVTNNFFSLVRFEVEPRIMSTTKHTKNTKKGEEEYL